MPPRIFWTEQQLALLHKHYPNERTCDLANIIGRDIASIYSKANKLGITKSAEFLASPASGRTNGKQGIGSRFVKGQQSWNKGVHYMPGGRGAESRFKKGHRGGRALENYQPIGAERISKDGYLQRKINDDMPLQRRWRGVHILLWEAANGPLPKGHALVFRDGNKKNITLDNLEMVSRAELMRRNSYHTNYPKEVAQVIQLRGAIQRKINRRIKNERTTK